MLVLRVLLWVFLLDTAFVIFNNGPPRMVIREMANHLSVPDICFNSPTADQCYNQIRTSLPSSSHYWTMSFGNVFKGLCSESLPIDIQYDLALLGPLNLFALTSGEFSGVPIRLISLPKIAIHTQIFQYRNSWGTVQLLPPIQNALRNWKDVWQLSNTFPTVSSLGTADGSDLPLERMWERYGLCKYCPEYWLLANLMITHLNDICSQSGTQENAGQGHSGCLDDGPVDSILNKYDQTSMRQVNDLISAFQNYQIGSPISSGI